MQDDRHALRKTFTPSFHSRFCKLRLQDERRPALRTTRWITAGWSESSRDVRPQSEGELLIYWARWTLIHLQAKQTKGSHLPCNDVSLRDAIWNCDYQIRCEQTVEKDHQIFLCLQRLFPFQPCLIFYRGLFLVQRTALVTFRNSSHMIIIMQKLKQV